MSYRLRYYLFGGQPLDPNAWIINEDGTIFETSNQAEAEKKADRYNNELKAQREAHTSNPIHIKAKHGATVGRATHKQIRCGVVVVDGEGFPALGIGQTV